MSMVTLITKGGPIPTVNPMAVGGTRWHRQDTADLFSLDLSRQLMPSCLRSAEPYPYTVYSESGGMVGGSLNRKFI